MEAHRVEPGLTQIGLVNDGELDISSRLAVTTRWRGVRLVAGDGLHGFEMTDGNFSSAKLRLAYGPIVCRWSTEVIGWLRLGIDREV